MAYITPEELTTHIYGETIDAIADGDESKLPQAITAAIGEAKGYLSRFDLTDLFGKTGDDRDPILTLYIKNIARWHFIILANPNIDYEDAEKRYKYAIEWLKGIQKTSVIPEGWLLKQPETIAQNVHVASQPKRSNRY